MRLKFTALCFFPLFASLCIAQGLQDVPPSQPTNTPPPSQAIQLQSWAAPKVQHAYGLPETKPKVEGTLAVNSAGLTFSSKSGQYMIPWASTIALSNGSERVELWGTTGTIVRMMIPNGGGLAAAGVMHHKVYELTVEFRDARGDYHAAVFLLPGRDAARVLDSYTQAVPSIKNDPSAANLPLNSAEPDARACSGGPDPSHSVLVAAPVWSQADVPAAYRALVYEHVVDRLQHVEGVGHVYRAEEHRSRAACARYTVAISVVSFKPGSQVMRATLGPIGFFADTTQMVFNVKITDTAGNLNATDQIKAAVRGESQSRNVADAVAKKLAKYYAASIKQYENKPTEVAALRSSD
jgi:hypothetical protein